MSGSYINGIGEYFDWVVFYRVLFMKCVFLFRDISDVY